LYLLRAPIVALVGNEISLYLTGDFDPAVAVTLDWDFGKDATPQKASGGRGQKVVYSSTGVKIVKLLISGQCGTSVSKSVHLQIFDCKPAIPNNAIVVNDTTHDYEDNGVYWVNPGVTFHSGYECTIFAEAGSNIYTGSGSVLYLKPGASFSGTPGSCIIIYGDGASVTLGDSLERECANFDFDYTNAPPNAAHPLGVVQARTLASLTLTPNPTAGSVTIQNLPSGISGVTVLNILGESLQEHKNIRSTELTLDLSKFAPGTYYIRFESPNSVVTKMVVKQ
jgi:hypothetical protein